MKNKKFLLALVLVALLAAGCTQSATNTPTQPVATATAFMPEPKATALPKTAPVLIEVVPTAASQQNVGQMVAAQGATDQTQSPGFSITGVPETVDLSVVLQAKGADAYGNTFANTIGLGSQMMIAEPGSILYGPDEPASIVTSNKHGAYISPITQQLFVTDTAADNVAEGAFIFATGRQMDVSMRDISIHLPGSDRHIWFLLVRGLFPDQKIDTDANTTAHFSNYVAGHTQVMRYPEGAYISEGNFIQVAELAHTDASNCGAEGCSMISVMFLDLNTGAYDVIQQTSPTAAWEFVQSNWLTQ